MVFFSPLFVAVPVECPVLIVLRRMDNLTVRAAIQITLCRRVYVLGNTDMTIPTRHPVSLKLHNELNVAYMHIYIYTYVCKYVHIYIYNHMYIFTYVCVYMYACTLVCIYI